jgi:hypothetical protein
MLIYNVTTKVDHSIADEWVEWMQQVHVPAVMSSGCFEKYQLVRLLEVDEDEGPTFAAQYYAASKAFYDEYNSTHAPQFRGDAMSKWGNKFISFRSLMEVIP